VKRRSQREPLQYIVGGVEFFHVKLKVDRRALIPRPETEQLCEVVTKQLAHPPLSILDLGTGSGAIALALAAFYPEAAVTALEVSAEALALARENAAALGLDARIRFLVSDWFTALEPGAQFDLIVANPPYLSEAETAAAAPEVGGHEPRVALSPGPEGTEALARILAEAQRYLGDNGLLALETGIDQHGKLRERAAAAGFGRVDSQSGNSRLSCAGRSAQPFFEICTVSGAAPSAQNLGFLDSASASDSTRRLSRRGMSTFVTPESSSSPSSSSSVDSSSAFLSAFTGFGGRGPSRISVYGKSVLASRSLSARIVFLKPSSSSF
jgi:release factor glutamine methyltransferase